MPDEPQGDVVEESTDPATEEAETETESIEKEGKKFVPLGVLGKERERRRTLESQVKDLTEKAGRAEKLQQFATQVQPIIQALQQRPELVQQILNPEPQKKDAAPQDEELVSLAKTLDLYDSSGRPDIDRARMLQTVIDARVQGRVKEVVEPVSRGRVEDKAAANYQWMLNQTDGAGNRVDKNIIDNIVSRMPREQLADMDMAANVWAMAYGYQGLGKAKKAVPQAGEPVMVESPGGMSKPIALSDREKQLARELGRSEKDVLADLTKALDNDGVLE